MGPELYGKEVCGGGRGAGGQNCMVERSVMEEGVRGAKIVRWRGLIIFLCLVRLGFGWAGGRAGEQADVWTNGPASSHAAMQPCKHIRLKFNSRGGPPEAKPIYLVIFHIKIVFLTKEYFEFPMTFN